MLKRMLHAANQVVVHKETHTGTRELTIQNTVNDAVDMLAVKGDSWQLVQEQGKNLFSLSNKRNAKYNSDVGTYIPELLDTNFTLTETENGFICEVVSSWSGFTLVSNELQYGKTYTLSFNVGGTNPRASIYVLNKDYKVTRLLLNIASPYNFNSTITIDDEEKYVACSFSSLYVDTEGTFNVTNLQLEEGSTATPYEPFQPAMPSPEYPSEIVSVHGEMRGSGWNLYRGKSSFSAAGYANGTKYADYPIFDGLEVGETYTISFKTNAYDPDLSIVGMIVVYDSNIENGIRFSSGMNFVFTETMKSFIGNEVFFYGMRDDSFSEWNDIQIVKSDIPRPYDRHRGNAITLPTLRSLSDGTRDVLYVDRRNKRAWGERYVGVKVFDGSEKFLNKDNVGWQYFLNNIGRLVCSHFKESTVQVKDSNTIQRAALTTFVFYPDFYDKGMDYWKEWLADQYDAGTPVTVHYALSTPVIEELPYSDYLLETCQYATNLRIDCDDHLEPEISATVKVLGR